MKHCSLCGHEIRKIKGVWLHRKEHPKYSGVQSGGVTFKLFCSNFKGLSVNICGCRNPVSFEDKT